MKPRYAVLGFAIITIAYLAALVWADSKSHVFTALPKLLSAMPLLVALSMLTYLIRYVRWYWLLARAGNRTRIVPGYLAYLAGFAFTATPGKVGELLRIRYLTPQGVPAFRVLAAFIYERAFDLVIVLVLAALAITRWDLFLLAVAFVVVLIAGLVIVVTHPAWLTFASTKAESLGFARISSLVIALRDALATCRMWTNPLDLMISALLGLLAWCVASTAFVWLLVQLGIDLPLRAAFAIFPLAMLAGAASMLPGGIGSTEAVIVAILSLHDVPIGIATLAAVGIRLSSIWFAILCGLIAAAALEVAWPGIKPETT